MERGHLETNGQKLYYEIHGEGDPLLLIMGLGNDATAWLSQIVAFEKYFKVIVFDNRDAGRSSVARHPYTIADMARDTIGLMNTLSIDRTHILGGSMGGAIAQELAIRYPEKVVKLVLACTIGHFARFRVSTIETAKFIRKHDPDNIEYPKNVLTWCMTHEFLKNAEAVDRMLNQIRTHPFPQSPEAFSRQTDALCSFDALDRLERVKAPTLVMVGDQDILTPPWASRELAAAIPGAKLQVLAGGGHGLFWEIPEKANRLIIEFLNNDNFQ